MTEDQFYKEEKEFLSILPREFRSFVSNLAYETAHSYGMEEVLLNVEGIANDLLPAIKAYRKRIGQK